MARNTSDCGLRQHANRTSCRGRTAPVCYQGHLRKPLEVDDNGFYFIISTVHPHLDKRGATSAVYTQLHRATHGGSRPGVDGVAGRQAADAHAVRDAARQLAEVPHQHGRRDRALRSATSCQRFTWGFDQ